MPPRRDPAKPAGKGTKIPVPGSTPTKAEGDAQLQKGDSGLIMTTAQSSALDKILARFDKVDLEVASIRSTVNEGIQAQEFNAKQAEDKLQNHIQECEANASEVRAIKKETDGLSARANFQSYRLHDIEDKIDQLERERRKNTMIIEGVPDSETPSPEIIDELFADLKLDIDSRVCDRVYRKGRSGTGTSAFTAEQARSAGKPHVNNPKPRPIVVGFARPSDKAKVFRNLINLRGLDRWKGVYFSDDYTEKQKNQIRDLRALAAYARRIGREASVRNHHLWVDGRKYVFEEIGRLAPDLTLEKAKTIEVLNGAGLAFQSTHSPLSNLYPCNVYHRGEKFLSSEAALHHTRATVCKKHKEAHDILMKRDPYWVKSVGSSFKATPEWNRIEDSELDSIILDKFTRNSYCRDFLLATGDKTLYEATGDRKWACGIPLSKIDTLTATPPGENRMGKKLEKVRSIIREQQKSKAKGK